MTDHDIEAREAARAKDKAYEVERRRLQARIEREGYDPHAHLNGVRGDGDRQLLIDFLGQERAVAYRDPSSWLAGRDLYEVLWAIPQLSRTGTHPI